VRQRDSGGASAGTHVDDRAFEATDEIGAEETVLEQNSPRLGRVAE
jgi:hypothetical protein